MKSWQVWLRLGRVSNLPTVWTNVLAATLLAGGSIGWSTLAVILAASLFYEGGMLLNDACDQAVDARIRSDRPIPSGQVSGRTVFLAGFGLLAGGWLLLWPFGALPVLAGAVLGAAIVGYDLHHKGVAWSPLLMGGCRALVYAVAGLAASTGPNPRLAMAALALWAYVAGLSYAAKQENLGEFRGAWPLLLLAAPLLCGLAWFRWTALPFLLLFLAWLVRSLWQLLRKQARDPRGSVEGMIAGIALLDAVFLAETGATPWASAAVAGFLLTHLWQGRVPGT